MDEKVRHMTVIAEVEVRHQHVIISLSVFAVLLLLVCFKHSELA